jgi:Zn-dependent M28 family amino/carboxypeptidase
MESNKTDQAKKMGAIALIRIRPGDDPAADWSQNQIYPVKGRFYEADVPLRTTDSRFMLVEDTLPVSLPVFTVTPRIVNQLIAGTGLDLTAFEKEVQEKMTSGSTPLSGKYLSFRTTVESKVIRARNVLGVLEGEKKDEFIVIGAHYDHLGKTEGWIWNGADDNASGTVGVMTIAKAMAASGKKPEKSVVFAAWTAEEKGLLGSERFVRTFPKDKKIILNLNYDMIARNEESDTLGNKAEMTYTEAYGGIRELTEKHITDYQINLNLTYKPSAVPRGGSDHTHFAAAGVPVFYFMAAMHDDYHRPSDEVNKVNFDKMTDIIRLGYLNIWEFANGDQYLRKSE